MRTKIVFGAAVLLAGSLMAADSTPKDDVIAAAKKLGNESNYTWRTTVVVPEDAQFKPEPTDGKTEKDGFTHVKMSFFNNPVQIVVKGKKAAFTDQDGAWQAASNAEGEEGPGQFMAMFVRNLQTPADEVSGTRRLREGPEEGRRRLCGRPFRGRRQSQTGLQRQRSDRHQPEGLGEVLAQGRSGYEVTKSKSKARSNGTTTNYENDRTTTVEIKDVGKTKLEVPDDAKKKVS